MSLNFIHKIFDECEFELKHWLILEEFVASSVWGRKCFWNPFLLANINWQDKDSNFFECLFYGSQMLMHVNLTLNWFVIKWKLYLSFCKADKWNNIVNNLYEKKKKTNLEDFWYL